MEAARVTSYSDMSFSRTIEEDFTQVFPLFPAGAQAVYTSFFNVFPSSGTSFYGYEIPLATSEVLPDLLLCIHQPHELLHLLANANAKATWDSDFARRLIKLGQQWQSHTRGAISNVWFEYDAPEILNKNYTPNFFVGPSRSLHPLEVLVMLNEVLHTHHTQKQTYQTLLSCYSNLPRGAWISQVGRMVARADPCFRVFIQDMPCGSIPVFLQSMGYPGLLGKAFYNWLQVAEKFGEKVDLDIDIDAAISPKIGIEIYCRSMAAAGGLLKEFYRCGYCTSANFQKLKEHFANLSGESWLGRHHFLSHFKLVYDGHGAFGAKVYLGFVDEAQHKNVTGTKP